MNRRIGFRKADKERDDGPVGAIAPSVLADYADRSQGHWIFRGLDEGMNRLLADSIARLEALKLKLHAWPGADDALRSTLFGELDELRGNFLQLARYAYGTGTRQDPKRSPARAGFGDSRELRFDGIVGQSPRIAAIMKIIARVAPTDLSVLLHGETGTGKELFSRLVHEHSGRRGFLAVNCGAFPSGLIESELFGHVRGAFTGATADRKGAFEEASGGTIFLDEIGELELPAQVKLLRVLETGQVQRVGADSTIRTEIRVVSATNRDLAKMVADGTFREDLYYRLNVCPIAVPPLRERRDEVPILLDYFLRGASSKAGGGMPSLTPRLRAFIYRGYDFPGNIRELRNMAQYLAMLYSGEPLDLEDLPIAYQDRAREHVAADGAVPGAASPLDEVRNAAEHRLLRALGERHRGNMAGISRDLGLSRSRAYQLFEKHAIDPAQFR